MENDLISRSALKKEMDRPFWEKWEWEFICKSIDNAPTVETKTTYDVNRAYDRGYITAMNAYARPKGEWIDHSEDGYVECPICEHLTTCEDNIDELHYCWNCGADMRKGGAE